MSELDKILNDLNIEPAKKEPMTPPNPDIIDDLFKYFGQIFSDYERKNGLPPFNGGPDKDENNV